jgi:DNA-binding transcriptional MerR regulator
MSAQPAQAHFGIGEVLAQLRAEFPDIKVSKIRFLESRGLIAPARSPSRYRRFSPADVERLRYILTAQRDQYLPLRVIKERLGRPAQPGAGALPPGGQAASRPAGTAGTARLSRRELLEAAGIGDDQLAELEAYGLVRRVGRHYGQDALEVAVTVAALARYGVQARHLRTVRAATEREISLIEQVVAPTLRQRNPAAVQAAGQTAGQIAAALLQLHRALLEAALAEAGLTQAGLTQAGLTQAGLTQAGLTQAGLPGPAGADRLDGGQGEQRAGPLPGGLAGRGAAGASA